MWLDKSIMKFDRLYNEKEHPFRGHWLGEELNTHAKDTRTLHTFVAHTNTQVRYIYLKQSLGHDSDQTPSGGKKLQGNMVT